LISEEVQHFIKPAYQLTILTHKACSHLSV